MRITATYEGRLLLRTSLSTPLVVSALNMVCRLAAFQTVASSMPGYRGPVAGTLSASAKRLTLDIFKGDLLID